MINAHARQHQVRKAVLAQEGSVSRGAVENKALLQKTKPVKVKAIVTKDKKMVKGRIHD